MTDNRADEVWLSKGEEKDRPDGQVPAEQEPRGELSRYDTLLEGVKGLRSKKGETEIMDSLKKLVEQAVDSLSENTISVMLNLSRNFGKEDFIYAHSLNVCLLSVMLGMRRGFDRRRLKDMALLALTHAKKDIGVPENLLKWIESDKEMDEIIKLSDVYDTLTHPPAYRHKLTASDTLVSIMDAYGVFDPALVKILMEELSFYPEGSKVELSTKQRGTVIRTNKGQPMRPVVEVDEGGQQMTIDLSKNLLIHITRSF